MPGNHRRLAKATMVMSIWGVMMVVWVVDMKAPGGAMDEVQNERVKERENLLETASPLPSRTPVAASPLPAKTGSNPKKLTITLSATSSDGNGYPRIPLLLKSLNAFGLEWIHEVILTVPQPDVAPTKKITDSNKGMLSVNIVSETELLPTPIADLKELTPTRERSEHGGRGTGYRLSMILKLAVAKLVKTDFYVTMDCDTFLKLKVTYEDLVPEGKAIIQGYDDGRHRKSWWDSSARILKAITVTHPPFIGVTPAILSTNVTMSLLTHLGLSSFDSRLMSALSQPPTSDWTEYTLYWTYAASRNLTGSYHHLAAHSPLRLYDTSGFEWGSFSRMNLKRIFASKEVFGVVQSINGAPAPAVIKALEPLFKT